MGSVNHMAVSATLHCLTGCAIGEIAGLMIGTAVGLSTRRDDRPLDQPGLLVRLHPVDAAAAQGRPGVGTALSVVLAADTLSIATMEIVDNAVMALIPGAMDAGLVNVTFWVGMMIALTAAFFAAWPVNRYLLQRGKGHALTHEYHGAEAVATGPRRFIPSFGTGALVATILPSCSVAWSSRSPPRCRPRTTAAPTPRRWCTSDVLTLCGRLNAPGRRWATIGSGRSRCVRVAPLQAHGPRATWPRSAVG